MTTYSETIELMWLDIWGNSLLASAALIVVFVALCAIRKHDIPSSALVIVPVLYGLLFVEYLPIAIKGIFVLIVMGTWGMALLKVAGLRGT